MPVTPHPAADYQFVFRRVVKFLGAASNNDPEGATIAANSPYTNELLKKGIFQADFEVCGLIASAENHTYRSKFFTQDPAVVADGARIPGYIGVHGGAMVEVEPNVFEKGRLAQSFARLQSVKDRIELFSIGASADKLYFIDNGIVHTATGANIKILVPTIPEATEVGNAITLHTPKIYQNALIAHTIANLRPPGADVAHRNDWAGIMSVYSAMIMANSGTLPEPEQYQRISK